MLGSGAIAFVLGAGCVVSNPMALGLAGRWGEGAGNAKCRTCRARSAPGRRSRLLAWLVACPSRQQRQVGGWLSAVQRPLGAAGGCVIVVVAGSSEQASQAKARQTIMA